MQLRLFHFREDTGDYKCEATNSIGMTRSVGVNTLVLRK